MKRQIFLFVASFIGDCMEKFVFICTVLLVIVCGVLYWFRPAKEVQASGQKVGNSDYGVVYINPDTVEAVQKDNVYYLVVSVEEVYTDEKFLEQLLLKTQYQLQTYHHQKKQIFYVYLKFVEYLK